MRWVLRGAGYAAVADGLLIQGYGYLFGDMKAIYDGILVLVVGVVLLTVTSPALYGDRAEALLCDRLAWHSPGESVVLGEYRYWWCSRCGSLHSPVRRHPLATVQEEDLDG